MAQGGVLGHVLGMVGSLVGDVTALVVGLAMAGGNLTAEVARVPVVVTQVTGWILVIFSVVGIVTALLVAVRNFTK